MKQPRGNVMRCRHRHGLAWAVMVSLMLIIVAGCSDNGGDGDDLTAEILSPASDVTIPSG